MSGQFFWRRVMLNRIKLNTKMMFQNIKLTNMGAHLAPLGHHHLRGHPRPRVAAPADELVVGHRRQPRRLLVRLTRRPHVRIPLRPPLGGVRGRLRHRPVEPGGLRNPHFLLGGGGFLFLHHRRDVGSLFRHLGVHEHLAVRAT